MQSFLKQYGKILLVVGALVLAALTATKCAHDQQSALSAAADSLHAAQGQLHAALQANATRDTAIVTLTQTADKNQILASRQKRYADSAKAEAQSLRAIIDTTPLPILAVCAPIINQANAIIAKDTVIIHILLDANDSLAKAFDNEHAAASGLRAALDSAIASQSLLTRAALHEDSAATAIVHAARPNLLKRLLLTAAPKFGVGAAAGIDAATHKPALVIGVTFGWPR